MESERYYHYFRAAIRMFTIGEGLCMFRALAIYRMGIIQIRDLEMR